MIMYSHFPNSTLAPQRTTPAKGWQPPSVEDLQRALPQYEVSAFIARGGMGAVYKGMQKTLRRVVAIKVLPPDIEEDHDGHFVERFRHEAQAMARLTHPNIVAVYEAGETSLGLLYFVMEFIEGTDVARLIASEGKLEPQRAIQITTAVCDALAFAHEEGIIHRDIKPSNIMLDRKGRVKVADFGLAKAVNLESTLLTGSNMAMGTPDFIAPETMISGTLVDQRADLYAVGVMLYQMLTGRIPRGRFALPSGVIPQLDPRLDAIVDKAMQTDREKRYSTATQLKMDVEAVGQALRLPGSTQAGGAPTQAGGAPGGAPALQTETETGGQRTNLEIRSTSRRAPLLIGAAAIVLISSILWLLMIKRPKSAGSNPLSKKPPAVQPIWQKLPRPESAVLKASGNASLTPAGAIVAPGGFKLPNVSARNIGIRGELKYLPGMTTGQVTVSLRLGGAASTNVSPGAVVTRASRQLGIASKSFRLQTVRARSGLPDDLEFVGLANSACPPSVDLAAQWAPFEFAVIGDASFARVGGSHLLKGHSPEAQGTGNIQLMGGEFRNLGMHFTPLTTTYSGEGAIVVASSRA